MSEFGDLESLDIDKLLRIAEDYAVRSDELRERVSTLKGSAVSGDGRVKVTCTPGGGIEDLHLDPRALRMPAKELAETIKRLIREADQDLQAKVQEAMTDVMGETGTQAALQKQHELFTEQAKEAAAAHERVVNDTLGELERLRNQLGI